MKRKRILLLLVILCFSHTGCTSLLSSGQKIDGEVSIDGVSLKGLKLSEVREIVSEKAQSKYVPPKEATYDEVTWAVDPGKEGKKVNIEKTMDLIKNAGDGEQIELVVETIPIAENMPIHQISEYETEILNNQAARVNNIKIAAKTLNNTIIEPGEEFSFNGRLGKRTEEKGYKLAPIYKQTEEGIVDAKGTGGGICQVSSTLYNAADNCGLKITERHRHSKPVPYVPENRDATVVYGGADLKFVNSREYPVMLKVWVEDNKVKITVLEKRVR